MTGGMQNAPASNPFALSALAEPSAQLAARLGKPPEELNLTAEDCRKLTEGFAGVRPAAIECECRRILDEWNGPAKAMRYAGGALEELSKRISRAPDAVFQAV